MSHAKWNLKFIIFSLIGIFNTLFDLALYVLIYNLSHSIIIANTIATSAALIGSYFLNSRLTFKSKNWTFRSFALFIIITIFGLWFLQTGIIYLIMPFTNHLLAHQALLSGNIEKTARTVVPKLLATAVTFVWNFLWYSRVIFKQDSRRDQTIIALEES